MLLRMSCGNLKKINQYLVFALTKKPDAEQNPGATKISLALRAGDNKKAVILELLL